MNHRRRLLIALGTVSFAPQTVFAQARTQPVVIGYLGTGASQGAANNVAILKENLVALGWKEGAQFVIETRTAEGHLERLPALAEELAKLKPAVVVAGSASTATLMAKTAPNIPIVQAGGGNPVQTGLAKSLARPGSMVRGSHNFRWSSAKNSSSCSSKSHRK